MTVDAREIVLDLVNSRLQLEASDDGILSPEEIKDIEGKFHPNAQKRVLDAIDKSKSSRNWSSLPRDYEARQVKFLVKNHKHEFPTKAVSLKVNANKASTHDELRNVVLKTKVRNVGLGL